MSFALRMETRADLLQAITLVGGATESIFPEVEALLLQGGDYQAALEYVAARKKMGRYQSIADFLFCELHPQWRNICFRYYNGHGRQLREKISEEYRVQYNQRMLKALELAVEMFRKDRCRSWGWFREQVEAAIAA
jgi:hypothetical protein